MPCSISDNTSFEKVERDFYRQESKDVGCHKTDIWSTHWRCHETHGEWRLQLSVITSHQTIYLYNYWLVEEGLPSCLMGLCWSFSGLSCQLACLLFCLTLACPLLCLIQTKSWLSFDLCWYVLIGMVILESHCSRLSLLCTKVFALWWGGIFSFAFSSGLNACFLLRKQAR